MRVAILLLAAALCASAEFRRVEVDFEGTGCVSCAESLPGRLGRVRGVEDVKVDLDRSRVAIQLAAENKVRLGPLLARITQDGTKIRRVETVVRGKIAHEGSAWNFQPSGLTETYHLRPAEGAARLNPQDEMLYEIAGAVSGIEPGAEPILEAQSIEAVPAGKR
jgi:copper chaperone CopZ